eukprot:scaffold7379_cov366-Prasinococcus_capsulatus_cf.AAC.8
MQANTADAVPLVNTGGVYEEAYRHPFESLVGLPYLYHGPQGLTITTSSVPSNYFSMMKLNASNLNKHFEVFVDSRESPKERKISSFTTHSMVVYKPYMVELLDAFASSKATPPAGAARGSTNWAINILGAISSNITQLRLGFSEYGSYVSWVLHKHPQSLHITEAKTWTRHPLLGVWAIGGVCCPNRRQLWWSKLVGYQYIGWEVGHYAHMCHWDQTSRELYGLQQ